MVSPNVNKLLQQAKSLSVREREHSSSCSGANPLRSSQKYQGRTGRRAGEERIRLTVPPSRRPKILHASRHGGQSNSRAGRYLMTLSVIRR